MKKLKHSCKLLELNNCEGKSEEKVEQRMDRIPRIIQTKTSNIACIEEIFVQSTMRHDILPFMLRRLYEVEFERRF